MVVAVHIVTFLSFFFFRIATNEGFSLRSNKALYELHQPVFLFVTFIHPMKNMFKCQINYIEKRKKKINNKSRNLLLDFILKKSS